MIIKGKERRFELNVQSHEEIAKHLRDEDFANFGELYQRGSLATIKADIMLAITMNRAFEDHRAYDNPDYKPDYLTEEDFRFFSQAQLAELETELTKAMNAGNEISVETEEPKASGKNADGAKE